MLVPMPAGGDYASLAEGWRPSASPADARLSKAENGQLAAYIFVDIRDRDLGGYVADAQKAVAASVVFPPGYYVTWSGQFEYLERAAARLEVVVPATLMIVFTAALSRTSASSLKR